MRKSTIISAVIISCMLLLSVTAYARPGSGFDSQNVGSRFFGGYITYKYDRVSANKYILVASAYEGVDMSPSDNLLVRNFKIKASQICSPMDASYQYSMGTFSREENLANGTYAYQASQVTGIITCE